MMYAIPTKIDHIQFRSRLEARWGNFFSLLGWKWEYGTILTVIEVEQFNSENVFVLAKVDNEVYQILLPSDYFELI